MDDLALLALGTGFAVVTGANDGAALVAVGLANPGIGPARAILLLGLGVVVVPVAMGTGVADTIASGLAPTAADGGRSFAFAVVAAIGVVVWLTRRGLPTSLTLALVGGIVGTAVGHGQPVDWTVVGTVLAIGLAAPLVSLVCGLLVVRLAASGPGRRAWSSQLRVAGLASFVLQAVAYAANDGQKMLAAFALTAGVGGHAVLAPEWWALLLIGTAFVIGTVIGIRTAGRRLAEGIMAVRAVHAVASASASSVSVLAGSMMGLPVSMTQASAAALVGSGLSETTARIRWRHASRIAGAWVATLPAATLAGVIVAQLVAG